MFLWWVWINRGRNRTLLKKMNQIVRLRLVPALQIAGTGNIEFYRIRIKGISP